MRDEMIFPMTAQTPTPRLIAIGETMAVVAPTTPEPLLTAEDFHVSIGGAESNVAVHAATLGHPTAWVSALGDDVLGERVRAAIAGRGVDTRWVTVDASAPTGVYFKDPGRGVQYYRAGSAASRMSPATLDGIPLEQADIVHVSGITPALSPSCAALIDAVFDRMAGAPGIVSFDVNHRAALWPASDAAPVLTRLADRADLVFVGRDEAETLWGCATAEDARAHLPGPATLVVKDGDVGATEFSAEGTVFVPAIPTEVIEVVGAGDAFAAGYLAGVLAGAPASERLLGGHRRARLVLQSTRDLG